MKNFLMKKTQDTQCSQHDALGFPPCHIEVLANLDDILEGVKAGEELYEAIGDLSRYSVKALPIMKLVDEIASCLREQHEYELTKLDLIMQASGIGLWDMQVVKGDPVNPANAFTWSDKFRYMLGYSNEKDFPNVLSSWSDKLHPEDKERTLDCFARHLNDRSGKTPYDIE